MMSHWILTQHNKIAVIIIMLIWRPDYHMIWVFYVVAALLGYCDAVWQTQINGKNNAVSIVTRDDESRVSGNKLNLGMIYISSPKDHSVHNQNFLMGSAIY